MLATVPALPMTLDEAHQVILRQQERIAELEKQVARVAVLEQQVARVAVNSNPKLTHLTG